MRVKDLIQQLQRFPIDPESEVYIDATPVIDSKTGKVIDWDINPALKVNDHGMTIDIFVGFPHG